MVDDQDLREGIDDERGTMPDRKQLIAEECFLGDYPLHVILSSIEAQFRNYMSSEDRSHYVDIFYSQLARSREAVYDQATFDADDINEVLDDIHDHFTSTVVKLFEICLGIGINGYDDDLLSDDELQYILLRAYEYFILNAKRNFKVAIAGYVTDQLIRQEIPKDELMPRINELLMTGFNPIISLITPTEFLKRTGDQDLLKLYEEDHRLVGNFLLRYSPRFYRNETYLTEVINHITSTWMITFSLLNGHEPDYVEPTSETEVNNHGVQSEQQPAERSTDDHHSHPDSLQSGPIVDDDQVLQHEPVHPDDALRGEG